MQQQASFRHRFKKVNSRYKYLNLRGESVKWFNVVTNMLHWR
jgi:hypothetical protein